MKMTRKMLVTTAVLSGSIIAVALPPNSTEAQNMCGNGIIDEAEQCDSGELNSDNRNLANFCTKQCQFFWFQDIRLPVKCQIWDNVPVSERSYCKAQFGQYFQECWIENGETECTTEYPLLPQNTDSLHYKSHLIGFLDGHTLVNTAYNGEYYFINFKEGVAASSSLSTSSKSSTNTSPSRGVPPAGYEDEVLVNFDAYTNPFPDTDLGDLEGRAAAELYRRAVIGGFPDGEFKGNRSVNRAEAAKFLLLARYAAITDVSNNGRFPDVLDNQWYTKFVVTAADKGIINGHPDGTFRPADTVNTAEFLKMLTLTFDLSLNESHSYKDVQSSDWFSAYAETAHRYDLFPEQSEYLQPERKLTRNDVSVALYQFLKNRSQAGE